MAGVRAKRRAQGKFQGWFIDYRGKQKFFEGTRSRAETMRVAQRLEGEHRQMRLGYIPLKTRRHKTFAEAKTEYLAWGKAQGGRDGRPWGATHFRNRKAQLTWWHAHLGDTVEDIRLSTVETLLRELHEERTPKTVANYGETISAFCDWCAERGYLDSDPLKDLRHLDTTPQSHRRVMTVEEIAQLLNVCAPHTRLLLETAFLTGLRANELRNLTVDHLDAKRGGLILDAAWTKNRKPGFQPLPTFLVERLQAFAGEATALYEKMYQRGGATGDGIKNPLLYVPSHPARSLDMDLEKAGIPKVTPKGKIDFHAVRLAYINLVILFPAAS
jgi:integrase